MMRKRTDFSAKPGVAHTKHYNIRELLYLSEDKHKS